MNLDYQIPIRDYIALRYKPEKEIHNNNQIYIIHETTDDPSFSAFSNVHTYLYWFEIIRRDYKFVFLESDLLEVEVMI